MASRIKQDMSGKRKSHRVLKNLDQVLKKLEMDLEVEKNFDKQNSLHTNQNVEDKDFAKAAIRLIISSSRKDFITLCTKVALILKENHELRNKINSQSESFNTLSKVNRRSRTTQKDVEDNQLTTNSVTGINYMKLAKKPIGTSQILVSTTAEVYKHRQEKCPADVLDSNGDLNHVLPVLASPPDASSENISKTKRSSITSNSKDIELTKYDRSTLETISSESSENLSENVIQPKNETRKAVQFWKNKYFKQNHRIVELEEEKKYLEDQITFLESAKSTSQEIVALSMEVEPVTEPRKFRGWERLLERLHDIPLLAPVPLQGCKCSQCECMFNPIYYSDFKDAKMYKLLSNSDSLLRIGDLVLIPGDRICQISYIGHLDEPGLLEAVFVGLILKRAEGCSDGVHRGRRYFSCEDGDCKINQAGSYLDTDNVYQCPDDKVCCMEGEKASCCGDKAVNDQVIDQVKLWGCVLGAAVGVGILICCCRRDSCCNEDTNCKYYMTCKCCCGRTAHDDVAYEKFPSPSNSSDSIDSCTKNPPQVSQQFQDNVKLVSPAILTTEAHSKTEKLAPHV